MTRSTIAHGLLAAFLLMGYCNSAKGEEDGILRFNDGSFIPISALETIPHTAASPHDSRFKVSSLLFKEDAVFGADSLQSLKWNREPFSTSNYSIISLRDGSKVMGRILGVGDRTVKIETAWSNALNVSPGMISSVKVTPYGKIYYEGTSSLKGWELSHENSWVARGDAFFSANSGAQISRDINLPPMFRLSMKLKPDGYVDMTVGLWHAPLKSQPSNFAQMRIVGRSIRIEKYEDNRYVPLFSHVITGELKIGTVDLFADRNSNRYIVYINGKEALNEMTDSEKIESETDYRTSVRGQYGTCLSLWSPSKTGISGLRVSEWDGTAPGNSIDADETELAEGENGGSRHDDVVFLKNGDRLRGEVSFDANDISIKSPHYDIKIPFSVVNSFHLLKKNTEDGGNEGIAASGGSSGTTPVMLNFSDGSKIRANLCEIDGKSLSFELPGITGRFSSALNLVSEIVFLKESGKSPAPKTRRSE